MGGSSSTETEQAETPVRPSSSSDRHRVVITSSSRYRHRVVISSSNDSDSVDSIRREMWRPSEMIREHHEALNPFRLHTLLHEEQAETPVTPNSSDRHRVDSIRREMWWPSEMIREHHEALNPFRHHTLFHEEPDVQPVTRSSSYEFLPPSMSELRVVLLGNSWSERSSVGNFILGETKFNTEEEPDQCLRVSGQLQEKKIVLINTPDLLHPWSSHERLNVSSCMSLSSPGPHVFLLVIQPEDFTSMDERRLCSFLRLFGDQSFDHSLVLISTPREEQSGFMDRYLQHPPLKEMIKKCKYRFLWRKNLELPELLTRLGQVVKEHNGEHVDP